MLKSTLRAKGSGLLVAAALASWALVALGSLVMARRDVFVVAIPIAAAVPLLALLWKPWARRYLPAFVIVAASTYGGFALLEAAIRIRYFGIDAIVHPGRYTLSGVPVEPISDPKTLYRLRRNYRGYASGKSIRTNSLGFRGSEFAADRVPNSFRVLCFGSSLTMGEGVDEGDTWPGALAAELAPRTSRTVEVLNMGIAAFSPLQSLNLAEEMVPLFHPDAVVLDLDPSRPLSGEMVLPPDNEPVASTVQRFSFAAKSLEFVPAHVGVLAARVTSRFGRAAPRVAVAAGSLDELDRRLERLAELGRKGHFSVVVLVIRPMADFLQLRRMDAVTTQRIDKLSRSTGITFVDTFPLFAPTELPDDFIVFPGNGHPSGNADHRIARELATSMPPIVD